MTDVNAGLGIAPTSATLRKSRHVVTEHQGGFRARAPAQAEKSLMQLPEQVPGAEASQFALLEPAASCRSSAPSPSAPSTTTFRTRSSCPSPSARPSQRSKHGDAHEPGAGLFILPFFLFSALPVSSPTTTRRAADPPDATRGSRADHAVAAAALTTDTSRRCSRGSS